MGFASALAPGGATAEVIAQSIVRGCALKRAATRCHPGFHGVDVAGKAQPQRHRVRYSTARLRWANRIN